jgi:septation ring formation regulator EzrA
LEELDHSLAKVQKDVDTTDSQETELYEFTHKKVGRIHRDITDLDHAGKYAEQELKRLSQSQKKCHERLERVEKGVSPRLRRVDVSPSISPAESHNS